jgi:hypothetical protein
MTEVGDLEIETQRRVIEHFRRLPPGSGPHLAQLGAREETGIQPGVRRRARDGPPLVEPRYDERFRGLLDRVMPSWRQRLDDLNREPLAGEEWEACAEVDAAPTPR